MASHSVNYTSAATYTLPNVARLERVLVNTGVAAGTVIIRHAATDAPIGTIDAANPDIGRVFDLSFPSPATLEVVVSDNALDVTVLYD